MPSVVHGRDEFTDLPETLGPTENLGMQAHYCIIQHRTIVGEKRERNGSGGLPPENFSETHPLERQKAPVWIMG